ncbi:PLP-dependent aminotransferase family protein [Caulobacter sp. KR2-114]|uniref:MocR-like pyridoxine biosynthesis transcription factor PdxR n=1 Tax=Caulobacter sp. KR2-114 TaxID=3400912 RepID=UPI003C121562
MTTSGGGRRAAGAGGDAAAATALLAVVLDRQGAEPLGRQLHRRIRELILAGALAPGARLPSSRRLAQDLGVSRAVTLDAYDQLTSDGYVEGRRGSGQYVRPLDRVRAARRPAPLAGPPASPGAGPGGGDDLLALRGLPFDPDAPALDLFPADDWARAMARGWRRDAAAALAFDQWSGLPSLRAAVAGHLRALQGLDYAPDQVLITAGAADALSLIARAGEPGEAWVEDPGHNGARRALARAGLGVVPVPVDAEGLDVAAGRRLSPHARLALVTPARQFPMGAPLSLPRRLALMDWARETGAVVVADDYDSELRFSGRPVPALASLAGGEAVLSMGSFSRLTFPGLRLGYVVGPAALIARLVELRARDGALVPTAAQPALAEFIAGGGFARHLRALRRQMTARRQALVAALERRLTGWAQVLPQEAGLHVTVRLQDAVATDPALDVAISHRAAARGLNLDPLSTHAAGPGGPQGFLLGYAAWDEAQLAAAVETLARVVGEGRRAA